MHSTTGAPDEAALSAATSREAPSWSTNHEWLYEVVQAAARAGHAGFSDYWSAVRDRAACTRSWYLRATRQLRATIPPLP